MALPAITSLTTGAVDGDGVFDKLMQAGEAHLSQEYKRNRITGKEYSTVYLGMMQSAMTQAMQYVLQAEVAAEQVLKTAAEKALLDQKKITEIAQTVDSTGGTTLKQQALISAQTNGFTRDAEQKVLKIMMDSYAVQRSTDSALPPPGGAQADDLFAFITKAATGIDVAVGAADDQIDNTA